MALARQFAQEFALIHTVLEGLSSIDENDGHFIIELSPQFVIAIDVYFLPGETAAAGQFR